MEGIHKPIGGFRENYTRIEKTIDNQNRQKEQEEKKKKKKKPNQKVGNALENLANSLGQFTEDETNRFYS